MDQDQINRDFYACLELCEKRHVHGQWPPTDLYAQMQDYLHAGADIDCKHLDEEQTPLYRACVKGDEKMIAWLIGHGADVHRARSFDFLPAAIRAYAFDGARAILAQNPDLSNNMGRKALLAAIAMDQERLAIDLVAQGADYHTSPEDAYENSPLFWAVEKHQLALTRLLHEKGENLHQCKSSNGKAPHGLMAAAVAMLGSERCEITMMKMREYLTMQGVTLHNDGMHDLLLSLYKREGDASERLTKYLEAQDFTLGEQNKETLLAGLDACHSRHAAREMMEYLKEKEVAIDGDGISALLEASDHDYEAEFKWLLAHGADPNRPDYQGDSPIDHVAFHRQQAMFEALLERGADVRHLIYELPLELREPYTQHVEAAKTDVEAFKFTLAAAVKDGLPLYEKLGEILFEFQETADEPERPALSLLRMASTGMLHKLFEATLWEHAKPAEARALHGRIQNALPPYYRPQLDEIDLAWAKPEPLLSGWQVRAAERGSLEGQRR